MPPLVHAETRAVRRSLTSCLRAYPLQPHNPQKPVLALKCGQAAAAMAQCHALDCLLDAECDGNCSS